MSPALRFDPSAGTIRPMERNGEKSEAARVSLLLGPAGCGKTAAATAIWKSSVSPGFRPACGWLVPNDVTARALTARLLAEASDSVLVRPQVMTFVGLAERIVRDDPDVSARPIGAFDRRLLLKRIVRRRCQDDPKNALAGSADTPGLLGALERSISEFKRATADPEELTRRVGTPPGAPGEVLRIYRDYQRALQQTGAYDAEGLLWLARDRLRDVPERLLPGLGTLLVDGFTDFTPTQLELLELLSRRGRRLVITLPFPDETDRRDRLWLWTRRTRDRLRSALGKRLDETVLPRRDSPPFSTLTEGVFDYTAKFPSPGGLCVLAAPGREAEVAEVARRVKRLLLDGAPPGRIAVLARSMEGYRPILERVFRRFDIPVRSAGVRLFDVPIVRFAWAVADLAPPGAGAAAEPFAFHAVLPVLRNSYFRPESLGAFDATTSATAERIVREGNVLAGRDTYAVAARRLAARPSETNEGVERLRAAADLLERLFDCSQAAQRLAGFLAMIEALSLPAAARRQDDPARIARDLRALEALRGALNPAPDDDPPDLETLREALAPVRLPPARGESVVDALDVLDARAMRWDHVFLLGCGEGQFPQRVRESALLGEADRQAFRQRGVRLDVRSDLTAREMLLFYLAVSRSAQSLTLSYGKTDAAGRPGAPGGFLQALADGVGGLDALRETGAYVSLPAGPMAGDERAPADPAKALALGVAGLFNRQAGPAPPALRYAADHQPERLARAARGLWTEHRRWASGTYTDYDGRLSDPHLLADLRRRASEQIFSPAQLSCFGLCPWRYFARYVLDLEPLALPQRRLEAVSVGRFCHAVLCATFLSLTNRFGRPVRPTALSSEELDRALAEAFEAEARRVEARRPMYPALWGAQKTQMREQLTAYLAGQRAEALLPAECLHFELAFGLDDEPEEWMDQESVSAPVEIDTPAGPISLRGRIDRVDRLYHGETAGLLAVDYKAGALPSREQCRDGQNTQLVLYAAVLERLLESPVFGGAFHSLRGAKAVYFASLCVSRGKVATVKTFDDDRRAAMEAIGRAVEGIGAGRFDLVPAPKACDYCDYRRICHISPARDEFRRRQAEAEGEA